MAQSNTTVLRNTSGQSRKFGFIPPHGKELQPGDEVEIVGDVRTAILGVGRKNRRQLKSFEDALANGDLMIVDTPDVYLEDTDNGDIKVLQLFNGTLGVVDPVLPN